MIPWYSAYLCIHFILHVTCSAGATFEILNSHGKKTSSHSSSKTQKLKWEACGCTMCVCVCVCVCVLLWAACCCSEWNRWLALGNHVFLWHCSGAANCADDGLHSQGIHSEQYGANIHAQSPRVFSEKQKGNCSAKAAEAFYKTKMYSDRWPSQHAPIQQIHIHALSLVDYVIIRGEINHTLGQSRGLVAWYSKRALGWWVNRGHRQLANQHCCP